MNQEISMSDLSPEITPPPETEVSASVSAAPPPAAGSRKRRIGILLMIFFLGALLFSIRWWLWGKNHISTDNAFIEANIHPVASRVPGQVYRILVENNQFVHQGETLVELDPTDFQLKAEAANASLELAKNETSGDEPRLAALQAELSQARARLAQAESDLKRWEGLLAKEVVPREQVERMATARTIEQERVREKEELLNRLRAELGLIGTGVRSARIALREAQALEAVHSVTYAKIVAPADGYVTRKGVETGAFVQPGQPLMAVVALQNAWVTANYKERQLTHVSKGDPVTFTVDAYPGKTFSGKVDSIMAGTGAAFSLLPPENASGNYVKVVQRIPVKIIIDKTDEAEQILRVGMSVVPTITLSRSTAEIIHDLFPGGK